MVTITDVQSLRDRLGQELAVSDWFEVTQERINQFAEATGDHQWIHVDRERAAKESPYKTTIAHGFLTLSLAPIMARGSLSFSGIRMSVNYGLNRVRFIAPVPSGARVRSRFSPASVEEIGGGIQVVWNVTIEREGSEKPCCAAEWLVRYYPA
jgi:acyl dehydratase